MSNTNIKNNIDTDIQKLGELIEQIINCDKGWKKQNPIINNTKKLFILLKDSLVRIGLILVHIEKLKKLNEKKAIEKLATLKSKLAILSKYRRSKEKRQITSIIDIILRQIEKKEKEKIRLEKEIEKAGARTKKKIEQDLARTKKFLELQKEIHKYLNCIAALIPIDNIENTIEDIKRVINNTNLSIDALKVLELDEYTALQSKIDILLLTNEEKKEEENDGKKDPQSEEEEGKKPVEEEIIVDEDNEERDEDRMEDDEKEKAKKEEEDDKENKDDKKDPQEKPVVPIDDDVPPVPSQSQSKTMEVEEDSEMKDEDEITYKKEDLTRAQEEMKEIEESANKKARIAKILTENGLITLIKGMKDEDEITYKKDKLNRKLHKLRVRIEEEDRKVQEEMYKKIEAAETGKEKKTILKEFLNIKEQVNRIYEINQILEYINKKGIWVEEELDLIQVKAELKAIQVRLAKLEVLEADIAYFLVCTDKEERGNLQKYMIDLLKKMKAEKNMIQRVERWTGEVREEEVETLREWIDVIRTKLEIKENITSTKLDAKRAEVKAAKERARVEEARARVEKETEETEEEKKKEKEIATMNLLSCEKMLEIQIIEEQTAQIRTILAELDVVEANITYFSVCTNEEEDARKNIIDSLEKIDAEDEVIQRVKGWTKETREEGVEILREWIRENIEVIETKLEAAEAVKKEIEENEKKIREIIGKKKDKIKEEEEVKSIMKNGENKEKSVPMLKRVKFDKTEEEEEVKSIMKNGENKEKSVPMLKRVKFDKTEEEEEVEVWVKEARARARAAVRKNEEAKKKEIKAAKAKVWAVVADEKLEREKEREKEKEIATMNLLSCGKMLEIRIIEKRIAQRQVRLAELEVVEAEIAYFLVCTDGEKREDSLEKIIDSLEKINAEDEVIQRVKGWIKETREEGTNTLREWVQKEKKKEGKVVEEEVEVKRKKEKEIIEIYAKLKVAELDVVEVEVNEKARARARVAAAEARVAEEHGNTELANKWKSVMTAWDNTISSENYIQTSDTIRREEYDKKLSLIREKVQEKVDQEIQEIEKEIEKAKTWLGLNEWMVKKEKVDQEIQEIEKEIKIIELEMEVSDLDIAEEDEEIRRRIIILKISKIEVLSNITIEDNNEEIQNLEKIPIKKLMIWARAVAAEARARAVAAEEIEETEEEKLKSAKERGWTILNETLSTKQFNIEEIKEQIEIFNKLINTDIMHENEEERAKAIKLLIQVRAKRMKWNKKQEKQAQSVISNFTIEKLKEIITEEKKIIQNIMIRTSTEIVKNLMTFVSEFIEEFDEKDERCLVKIMCLIDICKIDYYTKDFLNGNINKLNLIISKFTSDSDTKKEIDEKDKEKYFTNVLSLLENLSLTEDILKESGFLMFLYKNYEYLNEHHLLKNVENILGNNYTTLKEKLYKKEDFFNILGTIIPIDEFIPILIPMNLGSSPRILTVEKKEEQRGNEIIDTGSQVSVVEESVVPIDDDDDDVSLVPPQPQPKPVVDDIQEEKETTEAELDATKEKVQKKKRAEMIQVRLAKLGEIDTQLEYFLACTNEKEQQERAETVVNKEDPQEKTKLVEEEEKPAEESVINEEKKEEENDGKEDPQSEEDEKKEEDRIEEQPKTMEEEEEEEVENPQAAEARGGVEVAKKDIKTAEEDMKAKETEIKKAEERVAEERTQVEGKSKKEKEIAIMNLTISEKKLEVLVKEKEIAQRQVRLAKLRAIFAQEAYFLVCTNKKGKEDAQENIIKLLEETAEENMIQEVKGWTRETGEDGTKTLREWAGAEIETAEAEIDATKEKVQKKKEEIEKAKEEEEDDKENKKDKKDPQSKVQNKGQSKSGLTLELTPVSSGIRSSIPTSSSSSQNITPEDIKEATTKYCEEQGSFKDAKSRLDVVEQGFYARELRNSSLSEENKKIYQKKLNKYCESTSALATKTKEGVKLIIKVLGNVVLTQQIVIMTAYKEIYDLYNEMILKNAANFEPSKKGLEFELISYFNNENNSKINSVMIEEKEINSENFRETQIYNCIKPYESEKAEYKKRESRGEYYNDFVKINKMLNSNNSRAVRSR